MWSEGAIGVPGADGKLVSIKYWVKHYEEPSRYGIKKGRISKLTLRQNGVEVANYDRGWDIKPQTPEAEVALAILMKDYN